MQRRTVGLFALLLVAIVGALIWFQTHQQKLTTAVYHGGMSQDTKQKFFDQGIDCQEIYEVQGYETIETILRMFTLSQHEYYQLNPGTGMNIKQGTVVCVKGIWGVQGAKPMAFFWPAVAIGAAIAGFLASMIMQHVRSGRGLMHGQDSGSAV